MNENYDAAHALLLALFHVSVSAVTSEKFLSRYSPDEWLGWDLQLWPFCRSKVFPQQEYDVLSSLHYTIQHCVQPTDSSCWCLNCISCTEGMTQDPTFLFICIVQVVAKPSAPPFAVHLSDNNYDLAEGSPEVTWSLPCFNRCLNFW